MRHETVGAKAQRMVSGAQNPAAVPRSSRSLGSVCALALGRHLMALATDHAAAGVAQELGAALAEAQHEGLLQCLQAEL